MSAAQDTLPYFASTGAGYTAFDELQGAKDYTSWNKNMRAVFLSLR